MHRGVAYWEKDNDKRIFVGTLDSFLYSIDACSGESDINFGNGGKIDLREGLGRAINNSYYGVNSPPLVCNDTVVVGSSIMDYQAETYMPPGDVRGFDHSLIRYVEARYVPKSHLPECFEDGETRGERE